MMRTSQALWDAGFTRHSVGGFMRYAPKEKTRVPEIGKGGFVHIATASDEAIRALWSAFAKEPRIRRISFDISYFTREDAKALAECLQKRRPERLEISMRPWRKDDTFLLHALVQVRELQICEWHAKAIRALMDEVITPIHLTIISCHLDAVAVERIADRVARGRLISLRIIGCEPEHSNAPIARALCDVRCKLESLRLDQDLGFIEAASSAPSSLQDFRIGGLRPENVRLMTNFTRTGRGVRSLGLSGYVDDQSQDVIDAISVHIRTLEKLDLGITSSPREAMLSPRIFEGGVLRKMRLFVGMGNHDVPEFLSALQASQLRTLRIWGPGRIRGLVDIIPKTLLHTLSYAGDIGLTEELGSRWFCVMEALLSIPLVPRISGRAAVRMLPMSDLAPRIAATLGWPVKRGGGALTN